MYVISRLRSYYLSYEFVLLMKSIFLRVEYSETSIDGRPSHMLFLCYPVLFTFYSVIYSMLLFGLLTAKV